MIRIVKRTTIFKEEKYSVIIGDKYIYLNGRVYFDTLEELFADYRMTNRPLNKTEFGVDRIVEVIAKYPNWKTFKEENVEYFI